MTDNDGRLGFGGTLGTSVVRGTAPKRVHSIATPFGRLAFTRDRGEGSMALTLMSHLQADHLREGTLVRRYDLGSGLVTHAGVRLLSQDTAISAGAAALNVLKYHASGIGTTAAATLDTALQTASAPTATTAVTGVNANADASPNANVTATGTINYTSTLAITEWGLFNQATLSGAVMWDHKVFTAINVNNLDSITFTYTVTLTSGG